MSTATPTWAQSTGGHLRAEDFRHRAACVEVDADVFFPVADSGPEHDRQVAAAKAVCAGCRVRAACLAWAMDALPHGVAGGLTEDERRQARARRRGPRRRCHQRPDGGTAAEVAAAGREAIRAGRTSREVAREFGVTERTATAGRPDPHHRRLDEFGHGGGEPRVQPGSPPDLPAAQPPGRDRNHGRTAILVNSHDDSPREHRGDDDRPPAVRQAAAGATAWRAVVHAQQAAAPDHADFYALAADLVATLRSLDALAGVLARQVAGYGSGRELSDDEGARPGYRLCCAVLALAETRHSLAEAERAANRYWSAIGHIGVHHHHNTEAEGGRS